MISSLPSSTSLFILLLGQAAAFLPSAPVPSLITTASRQQVCKALGTSSNPTIETATKPTLQQAQQSDDDDFNRIVLRVYDIGGPYTKMMSALVMKEMPAIWHVGIGVFGKEYWFSTKIESKNITETESAFNMAPQATYDMGRAAVDMTEFERHLEEELNKRFNLETYKVFEHNCNHFAEASLAFLTGGKVEMPAYILENSDRALEALPKGQAALTRSVANQVARCGGGTSRDDSAADPSQEDSYMHTPSHIYRTSFSCYPSIYVYMAQVARVVMMAWGSANRSKEDLAKKEEKRKRAEALRAEKERKAAAAAAAAASSSSTSTSMSSSSSSSSSDAQVA